MVSAQELAELPPAFEMTFSAVELAPLKVTRFPVAVPNWLLLMLMAALMFAPAAFTMPVKIPEVTTEDPCMELPLILTVFVAAVPTLFVIPVIVPLVAFGMERAPLLAFPSWLLLMLIVPVIAAVFEIPVYAPAAADALVLLKLRSTLVVIFNVETTAEF